MKKEIDHNEWIEAYLKGKLPANEAEKVQQLIATDPAFAKEVESMKELQEIIIDSSLLNIKNQLSQIHSGKLRFEKWLKRTIGFGSGALIIGLVLFIVTKNSDHKSSAISKPTDTLITKTTNNKSGKSQGSTIITQVTTQKKPQQTSNSLKVNTPETQSPINKPISNTDTSYKTIQVKENKQEKAQETYKTEKNTNTTTVAPDLPKINCSKVKIKADYISEESCNNAATGSITIIKETVKGGKMPYLFSLNSKNFGDSAIFTHLYSANYSVYIKDANNCILKVATIAIGQKNCSVNYQAVFAPLKGETWEMPIKQGKIGTIQIITKTGALVFSMKFTEYSTNIWNGENMSGKIMPMGLYQFIIKYNDGETFTGDITIIK